MKHPCQVQHQKQHSILSCGGRKDQSVIASEIKSLHWKEKWEAEPKSSWKESNSETTAKSESQRKAEVFAQRSLSLKFWRTNSLSQQTKSLLRVREKCIANSTKFREKFILFQKGNYSSLQVRQRQKPLASRSSSFQRNSLSRSTQRQILFYGIDKFSLAVEEYVMCLLCHYVLLIAIYDLSRFHLELSSSNSSYFS